MTPEYPVLGARPVIVDPEFSVLDAILRDNVTLVTEAAVRIDRTGAFGGDGNHYEVDAIVYATGFDATEYLFPMRITGRGGRSIEELWREGGARAHRFCMMPGFPNLWSLYGPNTNGGIGPGAFHELVTVYALKCMERLILEDKQSIEPTASAHWEFAKRIDETNAGKVWTDRRVHSYCWTQHGRSATMCPLSDTEIWRALRRPDFGELQLR
jgi:4-hydroxyacetophenone monooxygenase